jgi:hypothetical protein
MQRLCSAWCQYSVNIVDIIELATDILLANPSDEQNRHARITVSSAVAHIIAAIISWSAGYLDSIVQLSTTAAAVSSCLARQHSCRAATALLTSPDSRLIPAIAGL